MFTDRLREVDLTPPHLAVWHLTNSVEVRGVCHLEIRVQGSEDRELERPIEASSGTQPVEGSFDSDWQVVDRPGEKGRMPTMITDRDLPGALQRKLDVVVGNVQTLSKVEEIVPEVRLGTELAELGRRIDRLRPGDFR